jgi:hypothetical protein
VMVTRSPPPRSPTLHVMVPPSATEASSRAILGCCGLHACLGIGALEIGYWVHVGHVRRGLARRPRLPKPEQAFDCLVSPGWRSTETLPTAPVWACPDASGTDWIESRIPRHLLPARPTPSRSGSVSSQPESVP